MGDHVRIRGRRGGWRPLGVVSALLGLVSMALSAPPPAAAGTTGQLVATATTYISGVKGVTWTLEQAPVAVHVHGAASLCGAAYPVTAPVGTTLRYEELKAFAACIQKYGDAGVFVFESVTDSAISQFPADPADYVLTLQVSGQTQTLTGSKRFSLAGVTYVAFGGLTSADQTDFPDTGTLAISGMTNPLSNAFSSTPLADTVTVTSPGLPVATGVLRFGEPDQGVALTVPDVAAAPSTSAAQAVGTTWNVSFLAPGNIAGTSSQIILSDEAGAAFPGQAADYTIQDGSLAIAPTSVYQADPSSAYLNLPGDALLPGGQVVHVTIRDVTNPAATSHGDAVTVSVVPSQTYSALTFTGTSPTFYFGSAAPPSTAAPQLAISKFQPQAPFVPPGLAIGTKPAASITATGTSGSQPYTQGFIVPQSTKDAQGNPLDYEKLGAPTEATTSPMTQVPVSCSAASGAASGAICRFMVLTQPIAYNQSFVSACQNTAVSAGSGTNPGQGVTFDGGTQCGTLVQATNLSVTSGQTADGSITFPTPMASWVVVLERSVQTQGTLYPIDTGERFFEFRAPTALVQLGVLPYKILYQPPGDQSSSSFSLTQTQTSETDFTVGHSQSNTAATSTQLSTSVQASFGDVPGLGCIVCVTDTTTWDQTTSSTTSQEATVGHALALESGFGQSWKSYENYSGGGLLQLDTPGTQPWMFDQFVLLVHPQFAVWNNSWCDSAGNCQNPGTQYTMIGAQSTQFDVPAFTLLHCTHGYPLPVPGNYGGARVVLSPSECQNLLDMDPFAAARSQGVDPSTTLGGLATPIQTVSQGQPGIGTNGHYIVTLTKSQSQTNTTTQTSTFESSVESVLTSSVEASVNIPFEDDLGGAGTSVSYSSSVLSGSTLGVSYESSHTAASTVETATQADLDDVNNPISTSIWLDSRWDTLMFQVKAPEISAVTPSAVSSDGGADITITGSGFWSGPVAAELCPAGGGACTDLGDVSAVTDTAITATVPALSPGTYKVVVKDTGGADVCTGSCQLTVAQLASSSGPTVTGLSPSSGPTGGGELVTVTGSGFTGVSQVWFGAPDPADNPALYAQALAGAANSLPPFAPATSFRVVNDHEILACAPPVSSPETVYVSVYAQSGWSAVSPVTVFNDVTGSAAGNCRPEVASPPTGPPTVTGVSPASGPITGGVQVTITGSNFQDAQTPIPCSAACPAGQKLYLLTPPPVEFCALSGGPCATAKDVTVVDPTTIEAVAPSGLGVLGDAAGTVNVQVGYSGGFSATSSQDQFLYRTGHGSGGLGAVSVGAQPPDVAVGTGSARVSAVVQDSDGEPAAGVPVVLTTSFGSFTVTGSTYTDLTTAGDGSVAATLTAPSPGTATVTASVYSDGAVGLTGVTQVAFEPVPVIDAISTTAGPAAGGTQVTLTGSGFAGAVQVLFGATPGQDLKVVDDHTLTVTTPPGTGTVSVAVLNAAVEAVGGAGIQFQYAPATGASSVPVTSAATSLRRILDPGWNTVSLPFVPASTDLAAALSDAGASLLAAYAYQGGQWIQVTSQNEAQLLSEPMQGFELDLAGPGTVNLSFSATSRLNPPPNLALSPGWNLVGPSSLSGQQTYARFLAGTNGLIARLVDPNGTLKVSASPLSDTTDTVADGYAYWVYATGGGASLIGDIPTGGTSGDSR